MNTTKTTTVTSITLDAGETPALVVEINGIKYERQKTYTAPLQGNTGHGPECSCFICRH